ncbi:MAG TPA: hypothetical protein PLF26_09415 [Blastocatellia bacterium]|nr:hypothetical protein [Blastocatellia bacterium]
MTDRLSNEPTDAELSAYLHENLRMSALAWHYPDSDFATEHKDPAYLRTLGTYSVIARDFLDRIEESVLASLKRLNAVPRDDEFWGGRTASPTLYKLRDFNAAIIQKNPDDVGALWAQAALYIIHGSGNFGAKQWRRLHYVGEFDISWPIMAALVTEIVADPTIEQLVELIDRIEQKPEAQSVLAGLDGSPDPWILEWCNTLAVALGD